ncbi:tRNA (adenine(58)-N(1))-methyltransferase non-catalytic subunit TRM6-like [Amphibalanus amphitrite]|uniref:tRNA (adenine(58)-N(1))-methyltransferase non-catalytic subunit TRM6-like n=1 Tax=Amphibalanus amphitrite TaxID=1232801 RepID=UPI001C919F9C|nr:tRNA (adenine(58)-N(1))-methyltransferase non-catalytic subunit TRM6-like [Amphibalanus amphitrite]
MREDGPAICDGKNYIIIKGSFMKLAKLKTQKQCQLGRASVDVAGLLGHPVGTQFRLHSGGGKQRLMRPEPVEHTEDLADAIAADESAADNRNLLANQTSQAMTKERIMEMREQGATGREIVTTIVDNSTSFQGKTEFSQAKYVRKKQKKYFEFISVQEPTVRLVASMYYMQDPLKIMNLRVDSLSQLLTACSVRPGGRYLVLESGCLAVTVAAVLERLGGHGHLVHLFQGGTPQRHAVDAINFTSDQLACLSCLDLRTLMTHHPADPTASAPTASAAPASGASPASAEAQADKTAAADQKTAAPNGETALTAEESSKPAADGIPSSGGGGDATPIDGGDEVITDGGDDVTPATEDPAAAAEEVEGTEAQESRKRRLSGSQAETGERKSKYARTRCEDSELALNMLSSKEMDGLLLCCRQHPVNLLRYLLRFLAVSRPFAVFCPYKEPLLECYFAMKAEGCIMLKVTETWLRNYQVLPERTHPEINMSGGGGYILSGFKVDRSLNRAAVTD